MNKILLLFFVCLLFTSNGFAQEADVVVEGTVADSEGLPLPGVNVIEKGTSNGVVTNFDGEFKINVPPGAVLEFSFLGYGTVEVPVDDEAELDITMEPATSGLNEVVVVGYGTQQKVNLTGAVGTASGKRLENRPIASVGEGLQGVIPNLNINPRSGDPAESIGFNIRGFESINGGSPLILVDGVPMDLNRVNPNDIESVSVLKDAAAAAIYGARAAFGVVLVTTKSAKSGQINVNLSTQWSLAQPIFNVDPVTDPYEFVQARNISTQRGGWSWYNSFYLDRTREFSEGTGSPWVVDNGTLLFVGSNNYQDRLMTDYAPTQQHDVSISGGSEKSKFFASLGALNKDGYLTENNINFKRYNGLLKGDFQVNDWLNLDSKVSWSQQRNDEPHSYTWDVDVNSVVRAETIMPVDFPDLPYYIEPGDREQYEPYIGMYFGGTNFFPYLEDGGRDTFINNDTWLTQGVTLTPLEGLKIRGDFSYNTFSRRRKEVRSHVEIVERGLTQTDMTNLGRSGDDWIREESANNEYYVFNAYAEYDFAVSNHNVKAMVGYNQEAGINSWVRSQSRSLVTPSVTDIGATTGDQQIEGSSSHVALRGAFYRVNYNYDERYLIEFNGRYDGTSRFPQETRFGFFPSVSAGWRISEENFMDATNNWLDNLKVRASYGSLGNQNLGGNYYPYVATMGAGQSTFMMGDGRTPYISAAGLISPALTWETVVSRNIGLDIMAFNNRLDISVDAYTRDTKDMLMSVEYPAILGAGAPRENAADLRTTGWELALNWRDNIGQDWDYNFTLALSDWEAEIIKYENPTGALSEYYEGQQIGEIWGYESVGLFQTEEEVDEAPNQNALGWNWKPGDMQYADLNGDGRISPGKNTLEDPGDRRIIGNTTPDYSFGINTGISYKNFGVDAFFQGILSRDHYPSNQRWTWFFPFNANHVEKYFIEESWSPENRDAYFPAPAFGGGPNNILPQTRFLQQAGYIRLKNLNINYTFPQRWLDGTGIGSAQIYVTGSNLWEYSKIRKPLDPETIYTNTQQYPLQRIFSVGANISL